jgi:hypothetical protein
MPASTSDFVASTLYVADARSLTALPNNVYARRQLIRCWMMSQASSNAEYETWINDNESPSTRRTAPSQPAQVTPLTPAHVTRRKKKWVRSIVVGCRTKSNRNGSQPSSAGIRSIRVWLPIWCHSARKPAPRLENYSFLGIRTSIESGGF